MFLPDTNILVYAFAVVDPYSNWLANQLRKKEVILSAVVVAEFLSGGTKKDEDTLNLLTDNLEVLPVDLEVARLAGLYKKRYSQKTKKVWLSDCMIAATCKVFGATLVTFDNKDFPMKDIRIMTV